MDYPRAPRSSTRGSQARGTRLADENKGSRPSFIALQTELLLVYLNGVRRSELVAPNSNSSSSGAE